jgi:hypothetical protein
MMLKSNRVLFVKRDKANLFVFYAIIVGCHLTVDDSFPYYTKNIINDFLFSVIRMVPVPLVMPNSKVMTLTNMRR